RELEELEMIFQVLHHGLEWVARSPQPKIVLDVLLVKCATADALIRLDQAGSAAPASSGASGLQRPAPQARPSGSSTSFAQGAAPRPQEPSKSLPPAVKPSAVPAPTPESPRTATRASAPLTWDGLISHFKS